LHKQQNKQERNCQKNDKLTQIPELRENVLKMDHKEILNRFKKKSWLSHIF
jgi:hypothetical protein